LEGTGGQTSPSINGLEMKQYAQSQVGKWKQVVRDANIPQQ
jgi:tripartite-type tricarboxylate transporter receptor subunit TctC